MTYGVHKPNTFFVSKIDLENMTKFAKLQDSRIKLVYKDEDLENFDYKAENRYDVKEKIKNFGQEIKKNREDESRELKNYNPDINIIQDYRITNPDFRSSEIKQTQEFRHTNSDYKPEDRSRNNLNNELASKEYRLNYSDSTNIEDKNFKNNRNSKFSKEEVKDYKVEVTSPYKPLKVEPINPKFDYNFDKRANDELYKEENRGF